MRTAALGFAIVLLGASAMAARAQGFDPGLADFDHDDFVSSQEARAFAAGAWTEIAGGAAKVDKAKTSRTSPMIGSLLNAMPADAAGEISRDVFLAEMARRYRSAAPSEDSQLTPEAFAVAIGMQPL